MKNEWVRNSGLRYIDFNDAVGSDKTENHCWYEGMLGSDKAHPSKTGARALYMRAVLDFPELMVK